MKETQQKEKNRMKPRGESKVEKKKETLGQFSTFLLNKDHWDREKDFVQKPKILKKKPREKNKPEGEFFGSVFFFLGNERE